MNESDVIVMRTPPPIEERKSNQNRVYNGGVINRSTRPKVSRPIIMDHSQQPSVGDDTEAVLDNQSQNVSGAELQAQPQSSQQSQQVIDASSVKVEHDDAQYDSLNDQQNDNGATNDDNVQNDDVEQTGDVQQADVHANVNTDDIQNAQTAQSFLGPFDGNTFSDLINDNRASTAMSGHPTGQSLTEGALADSRPRSSSPVDPQADGQTDHGTPPVSPVRPISRQDVTDDENQSIYEFDQKTGGYIYRDPDTNISFTVTKEQRKFLVLKDPVAKTYQKVPPWVEHTADVPPGDSLVLQPIDPKSLSQPLGQQSSDQQSTSRQQANTSMPSALPAPSTQSPPSSNQPQPDPTVPASDYLSSNTNFRDHHDLSMTDSVIDVALGQGDGGSGWDSDSLFDSDGIVRPDYHERHEQKLAKQKRQRQGSDAHHQGGEEGGQVAEAQTDQQTENDNDLNGSQSLNLHMSVSPASAPVPLAQSQVDHQATVLTKPKFLSHSTQPGDAKVHRLVSISQVIPTWPPIGAAVTVAAPVVAVSSIPDHPGVDRPEIQGSQTQGSSSKTKEHGTSPQDTRSPLIHVPTLGAVKGVVSGVQKDSTNVLNIPVRPLVQGGDLAKADGARASTDPSDIPIIIPQKLRATNAVRTDKIDLCTHLHSDPMPVVQHTYETVSHQSSYPITKSSSLPNWSEGIENGFTSSTAQSNVVQSASDVSYSHGMKNSVYKPCQSVHHLNQSFPQHSHQLPTMNDFSEIQAFPSKTVSSDILPLNLGTSSRSVQFGHVAQQADLKAQQHVQEVRQRQAAQSDPSTAGPSAVAQAVAPVQRPSEMLQQTEQNMDKISSNVDNTVSTVHKHVSFQHDHNVHDVSMVYLDGSPLRENVRKQNVLAKRLYESDGIEVYDSNGSAIEYAGTANKFKNVDGYPNKHPRIQAKSDQHFHDTAYSVQPDHREYKNRLIAHSGNNLADSGKILVSTETATTDTHHIARPAQHVQRDSDTFPTGSDQNRPLSGKTMADSGPILANSGVPSDHAVAPPPPPPPPSMTNIDPAGPNLQVSVAKSASKRNVHDQILHEMISNFHDGVYTAFKRTTTQLRSSPASADSNDVNSATPVSPGRQRAERVTRSCASSRENTSSAAARPISTQHFDAPHDQAVNSAGLPSAQAEQPKQPIGYHEPAINASVIVSDQDKAKYPLLVHSTRKKLFKNAKTPFQPPESFSVYVPGADTGETTDGMENTEEEKAAMYAYLTSKSCHDLLYRGKNVSGSQVSTTAALPDPISSPAEIAPVAIDNVAPTPTMKKQQHDNSTPATAKKPVSAASCSEQARTQTDSSPGHHEYQPCVRMMYGEMPQFNPNIQIEKFDPTKNEPSAWFLKWKEYFKIKQYPADQLLTVFRFSLSEEPTQWFLNVDLPESTTMQQLQEAFVAEYGLHTAQQKSQFRANLYKLKQGKEHPKKFIRRIMTKAKQLYDMGPDGKFTPAQEEEVKAIVLHGLESTIAKYVSLAKPETLQGIIDDASTAYEAEDHDDGKAKLTANLVTEGLQSHLSVLDRLDARLSRMENQVCSSAQTTSKQSTASSATQQPPVMSGQRPPRPQPATTAYGRTSLDSSSFPDRSQYACYRCGEYGHFMVNCPLPPRPIHGAPSPEPWASREFLGANTLQGPRAPRPLLQGPPLQTPQYTRAQPANRQMTSQQRSRSEPPVCQYCQRSGHTARVCYQLQRFIVQQQQH